MDSKKILSVVLKAPLVLLVIFAFFASIYASMKKLVGVSYSSSIILGIILLLYFIGVFLNKKYSRLY
jgi:hypothetical protein